MYKCTFNIIEKNDVMKKKIVLFMLGLIMMLAGKTNVFATYTYYSCNAGTGGHGWPIL